MRTVLQRARSASVRVDGAVVGAIDRGFLALVGVAEGDDVEQARATAEKVRWLRVFEDEEGKMNLDVVQAGGQVLLVSQFTLAADISRGRRPSFSTAAAPERARALLDRLAEELEALGVEVEQGEFGASMQVELINDGPVTFVVEAPPCGA